MVPTGIVKPKKRGGYFDAATVEVADIFYVAIRIRKLLLEMRDRQTDLGDAPLGAAFG